MTQKNYLECGKIQNTHGCHGWIKVESYCDAPEVLAQLPVIYRCAAGSYLPLRVLETGRKGESVLMRLETVEDMNAAEALKGEVIYAAREDIPLEEGEYFLADLPGLPVIDADSDKIYGTVVEVNFSTGQDMLVVKTPTGHRYLPMVDAFLARVDVENGVYVRPIPGLLEE